MASPAVVPESFRRDARRALRTRFWSAMVTLPCGSGLGDAPAGNVSPTRRDTAAVKHALAKLGLVALVLSWVPGVVAGPPLCRTLAHEGGDYTVCEVDLRRHGVKLFWKDPDGQPYRYLSSLPRSLGKHGQLRFAMNGGMYHPDGSPVGLYVENGRELVRPNTYAGPGNFHMRPNGIFYGSGQTAGVMETRAFLRQKPQVEFATQSGPMLALDGRLHPRFARTGGSRKYRVGVGSRDPDTLVFAVSEGEVS